MEKPKIVIIVGPTASGKSALAAMLAHSFNGEIINADSMQVYKGMDIGTAKPPREMLQKVPHHLIDIVEPDEEYTAASFKKDAEEKIKEIRGRGKNVFVAGGTGLYIKALTMGLFDGPSADKGLRDSLTEEAETYGKERLYERLKSVDAKAAANIHPNNLRRVIRAIEVYELSRKPISEFQSAHAFSERPYETLKIGLIKEREALYGDIETRVDEMMEAGLLEETKSLIESGYSTSLKPMGALGYKEVAGYLKGEYPLEEAVGLLKKNTRHYAKRQLTWFKKDSEIRWFSPEQKKDIIELVKEFLR